MSDLQRCKTCKWWGLDRRKYDEKTIRKSCDLPKMIRPDSDNDLIHIDDDAPDSVEVSDASGYYAALITGPEFGCVHHKPLD